MSKRRLDMLLPDAVRDALEREAQGKGRSMTALATTFIEQGLANEQGQRLAQFSWLREVVRAEVQQVVHQEEEWLHDTLLDEMRELFHQYSARHASLEIKAVRESETARRLLVLLMERLLSRTESQELAEQAEDATSRHLLAVLRTQEDREA